jgi:hypothetical protein
VTLLRRLIETARPEAERLAGERWLTLALGVAASRFVALGAVILNSDDLTASEIAAIEEARERYAIEQRALLVDALQAPAALGKALALRPLDGGRLLEQQMLRVNMEKKGE